MYICNKHGRLKTEWCDECQKCYICNCVSLTKTYFNDLHINSERGESTLSIYVEHCSVCGQPNTVKIKH